MRPSHARLAALAGIALLLAPAVASAGAHDGDHVLLRTEGQNCTEYTEYASLTHRGSVLPLQWSYRLCNAGEVGGADSYEIILRFRNTGARTVDFVYRYFLHQLSDCESGANAVNGDGSWEKLGAGRSVGGWATGNSSIIPKSRWTGGVYLCLTRLVYPTPDGEEVVVAAARDRDEAERSERQRSEARADSIRSAEEARAASRRDSVEREQRFEAARAAEQARRDSAAIEWSRRAAEQQDSLARVVEDSRRRELADRAERRKAAADSIRDTQAQLAEGLAGIAGAALDQEVKTLADIEEWGSYLTVEAGMAFNGVPLYEDVSGSDINAHSETTTAGMMGGYLSVEAWPYVTRHYGLGIFGSGAMGVFSTETGSSTQTGTYANYGLKAFVGTPSFALVGIGSAGSRSATMSSDMAQYDYDVTSAGATSYQIVRTGGGLRIGTFAGSYLEALYVLEQPDFETDKAIPVFLARLAAGPFFVAGEYASTYPAGGAPKYRLDGDKERGYFSVVLGVGLRWWVND